MATTNNRKDYLHTEGLEKLSAPLPLSNWSHWAFLMETSIKASIYNYVMQGPFPSPPLQWYDSHKAKVCVVLARSVSFPNLVILRRHKDNQRAIWAALRAAHERNSAGS